MGLHLKSPRADDGSTQHPRERNVPTKQPKCKRCGSPLDFQQPSTDDPETLLGVCINPGCIAWHSQTPDEDHSGETVLTLLALPARRHGT